MKRPFNGFGIILESILAATQIATLGTVTAIQHDKIKRSQKKQSKLLDLLQQQRMSDVQSQVSARDEAFALKTQEALYKEKATRKAAYLGVTAAIIVSLVAAYFFLRGGSDE